MTTRNPPDRPAPAARSPWACQAFAAAVLMGFGATTAAFAADEPNALMVAANDAPNSTATQFEVSGTALPRFDTTSESTQNNRIDLSLMPAGRSGMGLAMGLNTLSGSRFNSLAPARPNGTSVDLGLQWRYTLVNDYRIDVTAWRRVPNNDAIRMIEARNEPSYGARVEMGLGRNTKTSGFTADKGFLGFQLESGARISVKRKNGGPMFYYRNAF